MTTVKLNSHTLHVFRSYEEAKEACEAFAEKMGTTFRVQDLSVHLNDGDDIHRFTKVTEHKDVLRVCAMHFSDIFYYDGVENEIEKGSYTFLQTRLRLIKGKDNG